jgi:hypothetical protein
LIIITRAFVQNYNFFCNSNMYIHTGLINSQKILFLKILNLTLVPFKKNLVSLVSSKVCAKCMYLCMYSETTQFVCMYKLYSLRALLTDINSPVEQKKKKLI